MARDDESEYGRSGGAFPIEWANDLETGHVCEALPMASRRRSSRKLPTAIVISVIIQVGGLIWLSASVLTRVDERLAQHGERLVRFEASQQKLAESVATISERLARAEENISHQVELRRRESGAMRAR